MAAKTHKKKSRKLVKISSAIQPDLCERESAEAVEAGTASSGAALPAPSLPSFTGAFSSKSVEMNTKGMFLGMSENKDRHK